MQLTALVLKDATFWSKLVIIEEHVQNGSLSEAIALMCFEFEIFPKIKTINIGNKFEEIVGSQDYLCEINNLNVHNINNIINE